MEKSGQRRGKEKTGPTRAGSPTRPGSRAQGDASRRIGVLLNTREHFHRELLLGVLEPRLKPSLRRLGGLLYDGGAFTAESLRDFDGLIGCFYHIEFAATIRRMGVCAVNLSSAVEGIGLPAVLIDNEAVGRAAADHLLERGFWHFA